MAAADLCHELLHRIVPRTRLQFEYGLWTRFDRQDNMSSTPLKHQIVRRV